MDKKQINPKITMKLLNKKIEKKPINQVEMIIKIINQVVKKNNQMNQVKKKNQLKSEQTSFYHSDN